MGTSVYPATTSIIKSIQRGNSSSSGSVTITSVNTAKTFVYSFSNGSAGSAGVTGSFSGTLSPAGGTCTAQSGSGWSGATFPNYSGSQTLSAGTTSIISSAYGVILTNATTITVSGSCYWQVVEYN